MALDRHLAWATLLGGKLSNHCPFPASQKILGRNEKLSKMASYMLDYTVMQKGKVNGKKGLASWLVYLSPN